MTKEEQLEQYKEDQEYYNDNSRINASFLKQVIKGPYAISKYQNSSQDNETKEHFLLGSAVDLLLTYPDIFDDIYIRQALALPSDNVQKIINQIYRDLPDFKNLAMIHDDIINQYCIDNDWYAHEKYHKTRADKLRREGGVYHYHLKERGDKQALTLEQYQKVNGLAELLQSHPHTAAWFNLENTPGIITMKSKRVNWTVAGFGKKMHKAKCLMDRIYINNNDYDIKIDSLNFNFPAKSILPIDYKTLSLSVDYFPQQAKKLRYDFQGAFYFDALIYMANILKNQNKGKYKILPLVFIVGSFTENHTGWLQMTMKDIQVGRMGGIYSGWNKIDIDLKAKSENKDVLGYFDSLALYEEYINSGQWDMSPELYINNGKMFDIWK